MLPARRSKCRRDCGSGRGVGTDHCHSGNLDTVPRTIQGVRLAISATRHLVGAPSFPICTATQNYSTARREYDWVRRSIGCGGPTEDGYLSHSGTEERFDRIVTAPSQFAYAVAAFGAVTSEELTESERRRWSLLDRCS